MPRANLARVNMLLILQLCQFEESQPVVFEESQPAVFQESQPAVFSLRGLLMFTVVNFY